MKTVYSVGHENHHCLELAEGTFMPSVESPDRVETILSRIKEVGLGEISHPTDHGLDAIKAVHDPAYVEFLQTAWDRWCAAGYKGAALGFAWPVAGFRSNAIPQHIEGKFGYFSFAADCSVVEGTWAAAHQAAQGAMTAVDTVFNGAGSCFYLSRPPGHHAMKGQFGGYCYLNNAAVAAQHWLNQGAKRIAVLDVDYHHGNGTQDIFYDRADVLVVNIHSDPVNEFPFFLGHADETGVGVGEGANLNLPLPHGTNFTRWAASLEIGLERIARYGVDGLIVSLGVDTYEDDPISNFKLKHDDFKTYGQMIAKLNVPTVFVMEGGYAVDAIGLNTVNVLEGFEAEYAA